MTPGRHRKEAWSSKSRRPAVPDLLSYATILNIEGKDSIIFRMTENEKRGGVYGILAVAYVLIQYFWTVIITVYFKKSGMLEYVSSPSGFLPHFFSNLILSLPMGFVFIGSKLRYRQRFGEELDYVKTDRYAFTLLLTTLYTLMLPFSVVMVTPPTMGAYSWFYYLFFIAFFEEFLFRGLVPSFMERSGFPGFLVNTVPALLYGLYQTALPFARSGISTSVFVSVIPNIVLSVALHYLLLAAKKWSGAMWLPIILHAIIEDSLYIILHK